MHVRILLGYYQIQNEELFFFFWCLFTQTYHERPLLHFVDDDSASLGHPSQQHSDSTDGQPADIQSAGCCVQLMDFRASSPEGHQPAPSKH